ncbi:hypothetical protein D3C72_1299430 [compost metagenome]
MLRGHQYLHGLRELIQTAPVATPLRRVNGCIEVLKGNPRRMRQHRVALCSPPVGLGLLIDPWRIAQNHSRSTQVISHGESKMIASAHTITCRHDTHPGHDLPGAGEEELWLGPLPHALLLQTLYPFCRDARKHGTQEIRTRARLVHAVKPVVDTRFRSPHRTHRTSKPQHDER